jgi:hypothetical protein
MYMASSSNSGRGRRVYKSVRQLLFASSVVVAMAFGFDLYSSACQKVSSIESGRLLPGARVDLSLAELNAYAAKEAPAGVRNAKLMFEGQETVSGTALVDFGKLRRAQGYEPGWLMSKLLDGERPVSATARIHSGGGKVTVDVQKASISGVEIDGKTLDFLIQNFILPFYPEAMVDRPVTMGFHIDRLQLAPTGVGVVIGR